MPGGEQPQSVTEKGREAVRCEALQIRVAAIAGSIGGAENTERTKFSVAGN
jgi:hypothetical protein